MALYTTRRDAGLLKGVNRELIHRIMSIEIAIYQLNLEATPSNIYGESSTKAYNPPVRIYAIPRIDPKATAGDNLIDYGQTIQLGIMASDLKEANVVVQAGNIIEYNKLYYEVDNVRDTNYWSGRNPETLFNTVVDGNDGHGYNHAIILECHLTKLSNIEIIDVHVGTSYNYKHKHRVT